MTILTAVIARWLLFAMASRREALSQLNGISNRLESLQDWLKVDSGKVNEYYKEEERWADELFRWEQEGRKGLTGDPPERPIPTTAMLAVLRDLDEIRQDLAWLRPLAEAVPKMATR